MQVKQMCSVRELFQEAREMHNCLLAFATKAMTGEVALYQVRLGEQRLDMLLERSGNGWSLGDMRKRCNAQPRKTTRESIQAWLVKQKVEVDEIPF